MEQTDQTVVGRRGRDEVEPTDTKDAAARLYEAASQRRAFLESAENMSEALKKEMARCLENPSPKSVRDLAQALFLRGRSESALRFVKFIADGCRDPDILSTVIDFIYDNTTRGDLLIPLVRRIVRTQPRYMDILPGACIMAGDWMACAYYFTLIGRSGLKGHIYNVILDTGNVFMDLGYFRKAHQVFSLWFELGGGITARSACSMGRSLEGYAPSKAIKWYAEASKLLPDDPVHCCNYALALFRVERFQEGFQFYQKKNIKTLVDKAYRKIPSLKIDTDVRDKSILLYQEQGLGDTIQFIRFLPRLYRKKPAKISLCVPPTLVKLLQQSFPYVSFVDQRGGEKVAKTFDFAAPIPFLPHLCGLKTRQDIPQKTYLKADKKITAWYKALLVMADNAPDRRVINRSKPKIGLVWSGKRRPQRGDTLMDKRRSIPFETFIKALTPVDATLVSLQFGDRQNDVKAWRGQQIVDVMYCVRTMADTASVIKNLDLVISVDTSVAHLAAALGCCPVWLIDRWGSCWRWGNEGRKTPWYSNVRIFRRPEMAPQAVMEEIGHELPKWLKKYHES